MNRIFHIMVELVFWLAIFSSPLFIGFAVAFIIYLNNPKLEWLAIVFACFGLVIGILVAERIRRKYGCTRYMSRLLSTPDSSPTDTYDEKSRK